MLNGCKGNENTSVSYISKLIILAGFCFNNDIMKNYVFEQLRKAILEKDTFLIINHFFKEIFPRRLVQVEPQRNGCFEWSRRRVKVRSHGHPHTWFPWLHHPQMSCCSKDTEARAAACCRKS